MLSTKSTDVEFAYWVARVAHGQSTDKAGMPYIGHPVRVAEAVEACTGGDKVAVVVALLHDVVEDTSVTVEELRAAFGERVADAVDAISRRPNESVPAYYARVKADPIARTVKVCDVQDNASLERLALLDRPTAQRLTRKYTKALKDLGVI